MKKTALLSLITTTLVSSNLLITTHVNAENKQHTDKHQHKSHQHGKIEIPANQPVPKVDLIIHPDAKQGWNLELKLTNFNFAPEKVNQDSNSSEGHAHLYIDGKKMSRIYGTWYYLEKLPVGKHQITVSLNTNQHEDLLSNGKRIEDTETIIVKGKK
jgi:hypothetical protein